MCWHDDLFFKLKKKSIYYKVFGSVVFFLILFLYFTLTFLTLPDKAHRLKMLLSTMETKTKQTQYWKFECSWARVGAFHPTP